MVQKNMKINISPIKKEMKKLKKKDPQLFEKLKNKIIQISKLNYDELQHFKNLRNNLKEYKRVHVGSFVLTFKVTKEEVIIGSFLHHDKAYKKK